MTGPLLRIFLRILAGVLIGKGAPEDIGTILTDPEFISLVEVWIGVGLLAITEAWYAMAKRFGWRT